MPSRLRQRAIGRDVNRERVREDRIVGTARSPQLQRQGEVSREAVPRRGAEPFSHADLDPDARRNLARGQRNDLEAGSNAQPIEVKRAQRKGRPDGEPRSVPTPQVCPFLPGLVTERDDGEKVEVQPRFEPVFGLPEMCGDGNSHVGPAFRPGMSRTDRRGAERQHESSASERVSASCVTSGSQPSLRHVSSPCAPRESVVDMKWHDHGCAREDSEQPLSDGFSATRAIPRHRCAFVGGTRYLLKRVTSCRSR